MRSIISTKSLNVILGLSLCGITGYVLYLLFKIDDDDDYSNTIPKQSTHKTVQIKISKDMVRELIGRNGKTIKSIQEQSNTKINFKDQDPDESVRICVIRGTQEGCNIAENLIYEYISKQPVIESCDMFVPIISVGKIIGRCGENIMHIINKTGAKIRVTDGDRNTPNRRIVIKGTSDQINLAKSYIDEIVERCLITQSQLESTLSKREPRHPPKSSTPSPKTSESPRCERISPIPGQPDSQFEVYVSAVVDPSHFWVQIVGPKATELDLLVEEMTDYYTKVENRENHILSSIQKGDLVAAAFQYDNKWYRAEVLKVENDGDNNTAELYYVDYGDTDHVSITNLFELRTDFLRLHFQAIECFLSKVEPNGSVNWTEEAIDKFEEWTYVAQWKNLSAKLNGCCVREKTRAKREGSPVPGVELYDVSNDKDIDIAEELVKHGYAVYKKEVPKSSSRATSQNSIDSI